MQTLLLASHLLPAKTWWRTEGKENFASISSPLDVLLVRCHLKDGSSGLWVTLRVLLDLGKIKEGARTGAG